MKKRYSIVCRRSRSGTFYCHDSLTKKRESLGTSNSGEAERLINARNEAARNSEMNLQIAQVYLRHSDSALSSRTWQDVMNAMTPMKSGPTRTRWEHAILDKAFEPIRNRKVIQTTGEELLNVLRAGTVSTNVFLRRIHNFALGMHWIPWPILPKLQWPPVRHKEKRAITQEEHEKIIAREKNQTIKAYYQILWHLGGSQSDMACLTAEDVNWSDKVITYRRKKTGTPVVISFGREAAAALVTLPKSGFLFPMLARLNEKHRAKMFIKRLATVNITGISLHCYRYAWAERARVVGMPERFAQQALGHNSKAIARANSKKAYVVVPSLEEYEGKVIQLPQAAAHPQGNIQAAT